MGDSGQNSGMSFRGNTGWRGVGDDGLYATVDTTASGFLGGADSAKDNYLAQLTASSLPPLKERGGHRRLRSAAEAESAAVAVAAEGAVAAETAGAAGKKAGTVRYLVSLCGSARQWRVQGSHLVVDPQSTSFQFYLRYKRPAKSKATKSVSSRSEEESLADMAEDLLWTVSWIGLDDNYEKGKKASADTEEMKRWQAWERKHKESSLPNGGAAGSHGHGGKHFGTYHLTSASLAAGSVGGAGARSPGGRGDALQLTVQDGTKGKGFDFAGIVPAYTFSISMHSDTYNLAAGIAPMQVSGLASTDHATGGGEDTIHPFTIHPFTIHPFMIHPPPPSSPTVLFYSQASSFSSRALPSTLPPPPDGS
jgi:hypothetical protein